MSVNSKSNEKISILEKMFFKILKYANFYNDKIYL